MVFESAQITVREIENQLPFYLTQDQKQGLVKALNEFPNCNYYYSGETDGFLQGDCWSSIEVVKFTNGDRGFIKGVLLSNSCDIDPDNARPFPSLISFAPIISIESFSAALDCKGFSSKQRDDKLAAIRKQQVTSIFYLPRGGPLGSEYLVMFEDVRTVPLAHYVNEKNKAKVFTLSQVGFYLFVMKLSIHFCRLHENVKR